MKAYKFVIAACITVILMCPVVVLAVIYFASDINTIDANALKHSGKGRTR